MVKIQLLNVGQKKNKKKQNCLETVGLRQHAKEGAIDFSAKNPNTHIYI